MSRLNHENFCFYFQLNFKLIKNCDQPWISDQIMLNFMTKPNVYKDCNGC